VQDYPGTHLESLKKTAGKSKKALKSDRQRHLRNVKASEARKREKGLERIAIWVPSKEVERLPPSEVCQRGPPVLGRQCRAAAHIEKPSGKQSFAAAPPKDRFWHDVLIR